MSIVLLSVSVALSMSPMSATSPANQLSTASHSINTRNTKNTRTIIVQQYGDKDPHGADPHGSDPHDENHDSGLKSNADETARYATDDVYGGRLGANSQHPLDNVPPK